MNSFVAILKDRLEKIEENLYEMDEEQLAEKIYDLEIGIDDFKNSTLCENESDYTTIKYINRKIKKIKEELDLSNNDAELDMMFPNGNDEDEDDNW